MRFVFRAVLSAIAMLACGAGNAQQKINAATGINYPPITGNGTPQSFNLACTSEIGMTVNITAAGGVVTAATINAPGTGIVVVPQTVQIVGAGGSGAVLTITAASSGGATAITLVSGGTGYTTATGVPVSLANYGQPFQDTAVTPNTYYTCGTDGWVIRGGSGSGGITTLTGDVSASGTGSVAATLATVNANIGACGDATHVGVATVNAKGLTTACTPTAITAGGFTLGTTAITPASTTTAVNGLSVNSVTLGNTTPVVPHMSLRFWVFGDSYDQTFGATVAGNAYVQLVADDTPAREFQFAQGGTTEPTIAESTLANFTPDTTFPSTVMTNGGNNDYTADTCGHVSPSNCITNYSNQLTAAIGWTAFPPQDRTLASNGTVGTGCTANSTVPLNSINGNVAGTAESCTTAGAGITWAIPASNAGLVGIVTTNTNGAAGTYSVSIDGTLQTDNCTTTTTFGIGGCNGTAQNETISPQSQLFNVTPGVAHTIVAVPLTANPVIFIAAEWEPATLPSNQNATFVNDSGAAFDITEIYTGASQSVVAKFKSAGLPVFPVDIRNALVAVPGQGIGAATATCPGTTFANHPNDCGQYAEYQALLAEEQTAGYIFTSQGLGAKFTAGDGNIYAPWTMFQGQVTAPGNITFKNTFANFNGIDLFTGPTAGDTAAGWVDFLNGAGNDVSGWRMGSGAVLGVTGNSFKHTVFGTPGVVDNFCGEAMNATSAPGVDASYSVAWCLNSSTGLSYGSGNISSTKTTHAAMAFTVVAGSSCGTTTILNAGPSAGTLTTTGTTCSIGFNLPTAPTGWACFLRDLTTPANLLVPTATTVSTATFSGTVTPGDTLQLTCPQGY